MSVTTLPTIEARPDKPIAFWKGEGFPLIPVLILLLIAFVAIFADFLAPHDPQIGSLARRFRPPAWQHGGRWSICSAPITSAATCSPD